MRRLVLPVLLTLASLAVLACVAFRLPFANGPAEWKWEYHPAGLEGAGLLAAALLMLCLLWWTGLDGPREGWWALPLLIALGWVLTLDVVRAEPGGFRRVMASLASRNSFGYVYDEGMAPSTRELLADYPAATAGLNQHTRTHPPGPLLAVRALDRIGRRLRPPEPGGGSLAALAAESLRREVQRARDRHRPAPQTTVAPGTLVLLALLLPALSALTAWPLHRLAVRLGMPPGAALLAAAFWLVTPARSLFTPSLDQALPFFLLLAAWLAAGARLWRPFAAGLALAFCLFMTYGYLAAAALVVLLALVPTLVPIDWWRRGLLRTTLLAAGLVLPWLALGLLTGYAPVASLRSALAMHHLIAVAPRSYSTWLVWNPWDFLLLLGPAVAGLAAAALAPPPASDTSPRTPARTALTWGWWALLLLLLLSGSVRGEVGRIWLLLMPFACLLAAGAAVESWGRRSVWAGLLLLLQAALLLTLAANMTFVS